MASPVFGEVRRLHPTRVVFDAASAVAEIRVHIDTLEYTRQGLRSREPILLTVGAHNEVVLVRPDLQPAFAASHGGFAQGRSFPGPAVVSLLVHEHRLGHGSTTLGSVSASAVFQVFAHADVTGAELDNKELSDRRAKVAQALLAADLPSLLEIATEERWGPPFDQVMLRALECDPGPIDGVHETLTQAATERFQEKYVGRHYHEPGEDPAQPGLAVDGVLGQRTFEALLDAYLHRFSPRIPPSRFAARSANGCAAFNLASDDATHEQNRRVSLVVHQSPPEHVESTPCTATDPGACPVVDAGVAASCMWYREHVREQNPTQAVHHHFLPSWLPLTNDKYMLSVLTTLPDEAEVVFEVFASADRVTVPERRPTQITGAWPTVQIVGRAQAGVAQVVWDPPPEFAPGDDGRFAGSVPGFAASHGETSTVCHASYPAHVITILLDAPEDASALVFEGTLILSNSFGDEVTFVAEDAEPYDAEHLAFRLEGANASASYSLTIVSDGHEPVVLFEDVAFEELHDDLSPSEDSASDSMDRAAQFEEYMQLPEVTAETLAVLLGERQGV